MGAEADVAAGMGWGDGLAGLAGYVGGASVGVLRERVAKLEARLQSYQKTISSCNADREDNERLLSRLEQALLEAAVPELAKYGRLTLLKFLYLRMSAKAGRLQTLHESGDHKEISRLLEEVAVYVEAEVDADGVDAWWSAAIAKVHELSVALHYAYNTADAVSLHVRRTKQSPYR